MAKRKGQVALLLAFALAAIALFALLNVDIFISTSAKMKLENAGDAAAIAAARRQGELLNAIGRLNRDHIAAAAANRTNECREIVMRQRRLALTGPVEALRLASNAAEKNGMEPNPDFAAILREHAADVRGVYSGGGAEGDPYPEPYPGAWSEYAAAIENACSGGLAAGPDNIRFYDAAGGHLLIDKRFYEAVAARDWCWFHFSAPGLLDRYSSFRDWAPLPPRKDNPMDNSEIFSLFVTAKNIALLDVFTADEIASLVPDGAKLPPPDELDSTLLADPSQTWFFYDERAWRRWFSGFALADDEESVDFPLAGEIKPEYNVAGCASVLRCAKTVEPVAVQGEASLTWSAAAKPFGCLDGGEEGALPANGMRNFVLPCFTDVRLVPVDSVEGSDLSTADAGWVEHVRRHVPPYLETGLSDPRRCWYCSQLYAWESPALRYEGSTWLKINSGTCRRGGPGGRGGHGGTARGH